MATSTISRAHTVYEADAGVWLGHFFREVITLVVASKSEDYSYALFNDTLLKVTKESTEEALTYDYNNKRSEAYAGRKAQKEYETKITLEKRPLEEIVAGMLCRLNLFEAMLYDHLKIHKRKGKKNEQATKG